MACWVGPGPGKPSHKGEKMFPIMTSTKEKTPPEMKIFFPFELEDLLIL